MDREGEPAQAGAENSDRGSREIISATPPKAGEKDKIPESRSLFENPEEREVARATFEVIHHYERLRGSDQLQEVEIQQEIIRKVEEIARPKLGLLYDNLET